MVHVNKKLFQVELDLSAEAVFLGVSLSISLHFIGFVCWQELFTLQWESHQQLNPSITLTL